MSNLLINEPPLQVLPSLAKTIGLNEAIVLQQIHYWLRHAHVEHEGKKWVYKTYEKWKEQDFCFWSLRTIKTAFKNLMDAGLLLSEKLSKNSHDRVNYYTINYEKLGELEAQKPCGSLENTHSAKVALSENAHSANSAQSHSANSARCDSANSARCLREYKENTEESRETSAPAEKIQITSEQTQSQDKEKQVVVHDSVISEDEKFIEKAIEYLRSVLVIAPQGYLNKPELTFEIKQAIMYHSGKKLSDQQRLVKIANWFAAIPVAERHQRFMVEPANADDNSSGTGSFHPSFKPFEQEPVETGQMVSPDDLDSFLAQLMARKNEIN